MSTAYGIRIHEPDLYYICWKPNVTNQYRIFTLDTYDTVDNAAYIAQIALTDDQELYIQTESSMENLPSEKTEVQIEGR